MSAHTVHPDGWGEAQAGLRGSHLLLPGAAALGLGALLSLAGIGHPGTATALRAALVTIGWAAYVLGLILVGLGFAWSSSVGILHRSGLAVALLSLAQGAHFLVTLWRDERPALDPAIISLARLALLAAFALLSPRALGRPLARWIAVAAGAGCVKAGLRLAIPGLASPLAVDALLVTGLAAALVAMARRLRRLEDDWARRNRGAPRSDFSQFNNPQHRWNRPDDTSRLSCTRLIP